MRHPGWYRGGGGGGDVFIRNWSIGKEKPKKGISESKKGIFQLARHQCYVYIYSYSYICIYMYIYIYTFICIYTDICIYMYVCMYIYKCMYKCICIYNTCTEPENTVKSLRSAILENYRFIIPKYYTRGCS